MEYVYGALLLHKLGQTVAEDNLKKVITAAGITADESKVKTLIASLNGVDIEAELANATLAAASPAPAAPEAKKEEPKEKKEEAAEGLSALFG